MKAYVLVTGTLFGLLVPVHLLRLPQEPHLLKDPFWLGITAAAAALCIWAYRLLWLARHRGGAAS